MSLALIGLGLFDEKDLSFRAVEEAKRSDKVFIELYTSKWYGNLKDLEKLIGKEIIELKRKDLEENASKIFAEAKTKKIVVFVQGDPLVQTTHSSLLLEAKKLKVETKVIHNASILSAIGESGLHVQKFGPYVTMPFPEKTKGKLPESIFEVIEENKKRGLHTLCLLDVVAEENKYMTVKQGLEILLSGKTIDKNDKVVAFARAGSEKPKIVYDFVGNLTRTNIMDIPSVIIIPGKLHFTEREYLETI
ncbi:MAG: diphthine synthase [Candidatus Aenigmarchaeota archaeon]|nr:diphthine synthase [Candidatus Aenigmarchaeota archaeon]